MRPVRNSTDDIKDSIWAPQWGGGCFSNDLGLVIGDRIEDSYIHYHYERADNDFSQPADAFYAYARRIQ